MNRKVLAALVATGVLAGCGANTHPALSNDTHPVFDCQEDEIMAWKDAPSVGVCINVEEYQHAVHALAGHIPMNARDRQLARYVAPMAHDHEAM